MSLVEWINKKNLIRYDRLLGLYPLFFFIGARIRFSNDFRRISLYIPLRWYNKNNNGVMFGGIMCLISDPFPSLVFEKIIPGVSAWSKAHSINYLLPAHSAVQATIELNEEEIEDIKQQLLEKGKAEKIFQYYFVDTKGRKIALVSSTSYLRKRVNKAF